MVNSCKKREHTKHNFYSKDTGRNYLLKDSNELYILDDYMKNSLGLSYTNSLVNCHHKTQGFYDVYNYTVNIAFNRLLHNIYIYKENCTGYKE